MASSAVQHWTSNTSYICNLKFSSIYTKKREKNEINSCNSNPERGFPGGSDGKESVCNAGYLDLISGFGSSLGEGNGYPLQYTYLENSLDRGVWQALVYGGAKCQT